MLVQRLKRKKNDFITTISIFNCEQNEKKICKFEQIANHSNSVHAIDRFYLLVLALQRLVADLILG